MKQSVSGRAVIQGVRGRTARAGGETHKGAGLPEIWVSSGTRGRRSAERGSLAS